MLLETETTLLHLSAGAVDFALNWLVQSTLLIAAGLLLGRLTQQHGSAVQSAIYRTTLVAVLVCPLATWGLGQAGVKGFRFLGVPWVERNEEPVPVPSPLVPTAVDLVPASKVVGEDAVGKSVDSEYELAPFPRPAEPFAEAPIFAKDAAPRTAELDDEGEPAATLGTIPRSQSAALFTWTLLVAVVWFTISVLLLIRLATAWFRLRGLHLATSSAAAEVVRDCRILADKMAVVAPDVRLSPFVPSPCLVGLGRPIVLLPADAPPRPLRAALIHELAHLKRHDCHWNLLRQIATSLFFFQPLLWVVSRRIESTAEEVCDDYVIKYGGDRRDYANQLVDIAELASAPVAAAGVAIVSLRSMLARRVSRIMDSSRSPSTRVGNLLLAVVLIGGVLGTASVGLVGLSPAVTGARDDIGPTTDDDQNASRRATAEADEVRPEAAAESRNGSSQFAGTVIDPAGQPVEGARLYFVYYSPEPTGLLKSDAHPVAVTDKAGRFHFRASAADLGNEASMFGPGDGSLIAVKEGFGFAWSTAGLHETSGEWLQQARERMKGFPNAFAAAFAAKLEGAGRPLQLTVDDQPIRGRLADINGQPVAAARLTVVEVFSGANNDLTEWTEAVTDPKADFYKARMKTPMNMNGSQVRTIVTPAVTDQDGRFVLRGVGPNRIVRLMIEGEGIATERIYARTVAGEKIEVLRERRSPALGKYVYYPAEWTHVVGPSTPITGVVTDAETKQPLAGITVKSQERHGERISGWGQDFVRAVTNEDGRYELHGMPVGNDNRIAAIAPDGAVAYLSQAQASPTKIDETATVNFALHRGVWVEGRLTDGSTGRGIAARIAYFLPEKNESYRLGRTMRVDERDRLRADAEGNFRIVALPGPGYLGVMAMEHQRYPRAEGIIQLDGSVTAAEDGMVRTEPHLMHPRNYHLVREISPPADSDSVRLSLQLDAGNTVTGRAVDPDGKPVRNYFYSGQMAAFSSWRQSTNGEFDLNGYEPDSPRHVYLVHADRQLAGSAMVRGEPPEDLIIEMQPSGKVSGRLVDTDGAPLSDYMLFSWRPSMSTPIAASDYHAPPLPHNKVHMTTGEYETDRDGRFEISGLVPGVLYRLRGVHRSSFSSGLVNRRKPSGPLDVVIRVAAGESQELGDVGFADEKKFLKGLKDAPQGAAAPNRAPQHETIRGRIRLPDGSPAARAHVAVVAMRRQPSRGGDLAPLGVIVDEADTDPAGRYQLSFADIDPGTLSYVTLLARRDGFGVAWDQIELKGGDRGELWLKNEEPIHGRLVNLEGQSVASATLRPRSVMQRSTGSVPNREGAGYRGDNVPAAWLGAVASDESGRFTIRGVPADCGLVLDVDGNEQVAPQGIAINTGMPEQRGERDATYRALVKNGKPGEELLIPLAPAQRFQGVVKYADTGEAAPHARLTIWASQQEHGSMVSVAGTADEKGRYRISPRPGIRFGINAYPPPNTPYLARTTPISEAIRWTDGDRVKQIDVELTRGVLIRGRVVEEGTGNPISGASVQYMPESQNNPHTSPRILTGWQGIEVSDEQGNFSIAVLPGPGHLLVHRHNGNYVLTSISDRELRSGKIGGRRHYPHAVHRLNPQEGTDHIDLTVRLKPGKAVRGKIVGPKGTPIDEALVVSNLHVSPFSLTWRGQMPPTLGGKFELLGLKPGEKYQVHFLDPKRKLGTTETIEAGQEPTVELLPCGTAKAIIVDQDGNPLADVRPDLHMIVTSGANRYDIEAARGGKLQADGDFVANIDRTNYWPSPKTNENGEVVFPALIPGAEYRLTAYVDGRRAQKKFTAQSESQVDLGHIVFKN